MTTLIERLEAAGDNEALLSLAMSFDEGETLPTELIERLVAARFAVRRHSSDGNYIEFTKEAGAALKAKEIDDGTL